MLILTEKPYNFVDSMIVLQITKFDKKKMVINVIKYISDIKNSKMI